MVPIRKAASVAAVLVALLAPAAQAQVKLQFKFPEKTEATYLETVRVDQTLSIMGMDVPTKSEQSVRSRQSAGEKRPDGSVPVTQTVEAVKMQLEAPGVSMTVDSEDKGDPPAGELPQLKQIRDVIKALAGASYITVFDKDGKVAGIEGAERAIPKADGLEPDVAMELKKRFEAERLKRETVEQYGVFPDILLRQGEPWERSETMDLGGGQTLTFQKQYEYQGTVEKDGRTLDKIGVKASTVSYAMEPNPNQPVSVSKSDLKMESSDGAILFDREAGRIVESNLKLHIVGDMTLVVNGQDLPSKLDLTLESDSALQQDAAK
jgi:hypothetical protein